MPIWKMEEKKTERSKIAAVTTIDMDRPHPGPPEPANPGANYKIASWVSAFCMVLVGLSVLQAAKTGLSETDALIEPNTLDYTC
jgi:hypothetical protein